MNICSPICKHYAPFSDTVRAHNMFTIHRNKSSVNFTASNVHRLQKPNHASHLAVGGVWYRRVHCNNPLHSQRKRVRCTNYTRQLSTLYWTHHMTHQLKLNNCARCMRKRSLLSEWSSYICFCSPTSHAISYCENQVPGTQQVDTGTRLRAARTRNRDSIPEKCKILFSLLHSVHTGPVAHPASYSISTGSSSSARVP